MEEVHASRRPHSEEDTRWEEDKSEEDSNATDWPVMYSSEEHSDGSDYEYEDNRYETSTRVYAGTLGSHSSDRMSLLEALWRNMTLKDLV